MQLSPHHLLESLSLLERAALFLCRRSARMFMRIYFQALRAPRGLGSAPCQQHAADHCDHSGACASVLLPYPVGCPGSLSLQIDFASAYSYSHFPVVTGGRVFSYTLDKIKRAPCVGGSAFGSRTGCLWETLSVTSGRGKALEPVFPLDRSSASGCSPDLCSLTTTLGAFDA